MLQPCGSTFFDVQSILRHAVPPGWLPTSLGSSAGGLGTKRVTDIVLSCLNIGYIYIYDIYDECIYIILYIRIYAYCILVSLQTVWVTSDASDMGDSCHLAGCVCLAKMLAEKSFGRATGNEHIHFGGGAFLSFVQCLRLKPAVECQAT